MLKMYYYFSGGNLYRKERKKRTRPESKSTSATDPSKSKKSTVASNSTSLEYSDTVLLPKRRLPDLNFPNNLKFHTGFNCHLGHTKNMVTVSANI